MIILKTNARRMVGLEAAKTCSRGMLVCQSASLTSSRLTGCAKTGATKLQKSRVSVLNYTAQALRELFPIVSLVYSCCLL